MQPNVTSLVDRFTAALNRLIEAVREEQDERGDEFQNDSMGNMHYDDLVVVKKDYLLLTCCIIAIPSLLM
jgi:hypothetical protein